MSAGIVEVKASPRVTEPELIHVRDDGAFPNSRLPVLVYRQVIQLPGQNLAAVFERWFAAHGWRNSWRDGIYRFHHYHSNTHEVLGIYQGSVKVQLGGENGTVYDLHPGDVLIIPAGVAHKNLASSAEFGVIGAYPEGLNWDMNYGRPGERPQTDQNIERVPLPRLDPVFGTSGALLKEWAALS